VQPRPRDRLIFAAIVIFTLLLGYFAPRSAVLALVATGFAYIGVFFHEIGHTLFNWLYGYVALPAFDFAGGGGMTYQFGARSWLLQGLVLGVLGLGAWLWRPLGLLLVFVIATALLQLHQAVIVFMGYGAEIALGAFLCCRAYYSLWLTRPMERWLNAVIGVFMLSNTLTLIWALMYNPVFAAEYEGLKGGHRFGDFDRLQDETGWPRLALGWFYIAYAAGAVAAVGAAARYRLSRIIAPRALP
jgi:hypothetical protein